MILEQIIRQKILEEGPISFSEFMAFALYDKDNGFYSHGGAGRRKDFITSPEVGPLFGKLIAKSIDRCWEEFDRPSNFTFLECGAGPGTLARSILRSEMKCASYLDYVTVEPSERQRQKHPSSVLALSEMPDEIGIGMIFANELLDNLPFDIFQSQKNGTWLEVKVGLEGSTFCEELFPSTEKKRPQFTIDKDNVRVPLQLAAQEWVERSLKILKNGRIIIVDYTVPGFENHEKKNWLRTYQQHEIINDPFTKVGLSDITSDVDLSQLTKVKEPTSIQNQAEWLQKLGLEDQLKESKKIWKQNAHNPSISAIEARSAIGESEALIDPDGLGAFKVVEWLVESNSQVA